MEDTLREFTGTSQEVRIIIANADLSVQRGEIDLALQILASVSHEQELKQL